MRDSLTDQKIDILLNTAMADLSVDDDTLNEIAASPALWWGVQRRINEKQNVGRQPWPPAEWFRRWATFSIPAFALLLIGVGVFLASWIDGRQPVPMAGSIVSEAPYMLEPEVEVSDRTADYGDTVAAATPKLRDRVPAVVQHSKGQKKRAVLAPTRRERVEIKSEFIALTYTDRPESGHLVRVKVPSSMMVTLGLIASVNKPSSFVDAEVVVGEDGMTHSIRFIR